MSAPQRFDRRLATIFAADFVGFSRQVGADEEKTLRILKAHRSVIDGIVELHGGRIFNTGGDSVLAEFSSPVEAVRSAVEIQAALRTRNASLPEADRMLLRIGINLGDVVVKGTDLLGDAVNVAARLESLAQPEQIYIAQSVFEHIQDKLGLGFESVGTHALKNIPRPVSVYRVTAQASPEARLPVTPRRSFSLPAAWVLAGVSVAAALVALALFLPSSKPGPDPATASTHWLNGKWVGILTTAETQSDPLFCAVIAEPQCRLFEFSGVTGDGSFDGLFGRSDRVGDISVTVSGSAIRLKNHKIDAALTLQPSGIMTGRFTTTSGRDHEIRLRKLQ